MAHPQASKLLVLTYTRSSPHLIQVLVITEHSEPGFLLYEHVNGPTLSSGKIIGQEGIYKSQKIGWMAISRLIMATVIINSQQLQWPALSPQDQPHNSQGRDQWVLPLTSELLTIDRFWGRGNHCLYLCAHQAPMDSSKPLVTQMALVILSQSQTKVMDMNIRERFGRRWWKWSDVLYTCLKL